MRFFSWTQYHNTAVSTDMCSLRPSLPFGLLFTLSLLKRLSGHNSYLRTVTARQVKKPREQATMAAATEETKATIQADYEKHENGFKEESDKLAFW